MERHAGHNDVGPEQQRALDEQGRLIVVEMLPPAFRHEFRQDDRDVVAALFFGSLLDLFEQRLHQRTVWRGEYDQLHMPAPCRPFPLQLLGVGLIHVDIDRPHIV